MDKFLVAILSSSGTILIIIILAIFFWDKVELFISRILKIISGAFSFFKFLKKKGIQLDLQSRINLYIKKLNKLTSDLETDKIRIEYVNKDINRKAFIENGKVVLRLKKDDSNDDNFIHGTYLFVSTCLLFKVKHHLSPTQKESVDLYVTANLIKTEKNYILDRFLEDYLQPSLEGKADKKKYYLSFETIDEHGIFYPVFINELNYLGKRVFGSIGKDSLINEFDEIISFLLVAANRRVGDDQTNLEYTGEKSKILIFIIGKPEKISDEGKYTQYIKSVTTNHLINSIYSIGDKKNSAIIDRICNCISENYDCISKGNNRAKLNKKDGGTKIIDQYYTVMRKKDKKMVY